MGALNLPSASDLERLTRRLRSASRSGSRGSRTGSTGSSSGSRLGTERSSSGWPRSRRARAARGRRSAPRLRATPSALSRPAPAAATSPSRCSPARSASASIRLRPPASSRSETSSSERRLEPAARRQREQRRGLHLDRERAGLEPSLLVAGARRRRRGRSRRPCRCGPPVGGRGCSALEQLGVGRQPRRSAPSARLVPSAGDRLGDDEQLAELEPGIERAAGPDPQQPAAPSSTSSAITIAALGPPIPVLWIVSGAPSAARRPCSPTARGCG